LCTHEQLVTEESKLAAVLKRVYLELPVRMPFTGRPRTWGDSDGTGAERYNVLLHESARVQTAEDDLRRIRATLARESGKLSDANIRNSSMPSTCPFAQLDAWHPIVSMSARPTCPFEGSLPWNTDIHREASASYMVLSDGCPTTNGDHDLNFKAHVGHCYGFGNHLFVLADFIVGVMQSGSALVVTEDFKAIYGGMFPCLVLGTAGYPAVSDEQTLEELRGTIGHALGGGEWRPKLSFDWSLAAPLKENHTGTPPYPGVPGSLVALVANTEVSAGKRRCHYCQDVLMWDEPAARALFQTALYTPKRAARTRGVHPDDIVIHFRSYINGPNPASPWHTWSYGDGSQGEFSDLMFPPLMYFTRIIDAHQVSARERGHRSTTWVSVAPAFRNHAIVRRLESDYDAKVSSNSSSMIDDFLKIGAARVAVMSSSTYSWWATYASPNVETVHFPLFPAAVPLPWCKLMVNDSGYVYHTFQSNTRGSAPAWWSGSFDEAVGRCTKENRVDPALRDDIRRIVYEGVV
jgi:hypothetical protein